MIFDLSETGILENNRIWVIWALKKKSLLKFTGTLEKTFLGKVGTYQKIP